MMENEWEDWLVYHDKLERVLEFGSREMTRMTQYIITGEQKEDRRAEDRRRY